MKYPDWIHQWFAKLRGEADFQTEFILLSDSKEWTLVDGEIRHQSGRFFSVVGRSWTDELGLEHEQPFIEQREIGTLGFLINQVLGTILVQAKLEPGNIGAFQLSPTCQATASNAARIHGGAAPPFSEWFAETTSESLQSEQGTRFLGKRNRNALRLTTSKPALPGTHRWMAIDELLPLLLQDHLINTDARSVLVCAPWSLLVDRQPFTRQITTWTQELARSAETVEPPRLAAAKKNILAERKQYSALGLRLISLESMENWLLSDQMIAPANGRPYAVKYLRTTARGREVPAWDQPIIDSAGEGLAELWCARQDGLLRFCLRPQSEVGLANFVELGPSRLVEPGSIDSTAASAGTVLAEIHQSDEGGRFFQDSTVYRLIDVGELNQQPGWWLTLGEIKLLLAEGGWLTNEARSALSLVWSWL